MVQEAAPEAERAWSSPRRAGRGPYRHRTPHLPVTESHRGPASHPRTVRVYREQTCKEVIPREAEVGRQLCVVAAEGPAAGERELQAD